MLTQIGIAHVSDKVRWLGACIDRRNRPFAQWPHQPDLSLRSTTALADILV